MATGLKFSLQKGSDLIYDFDCNICEENEVNEEAQFYCEKCSKCYCENCVGLHNQMFNKHSLVGKQETQKWKAAKATVDAFVKCQEHKDETLKSFCEDHSKLLCHDCLVSFHRQCTEVVLIADKVKELHKKGEFKRMLKDIKKIQENLIQKIHIKEENLESLQKSYNKIIDEINTLRKKINDALDKMERNTVKQLDTLLATLKVSIQTDIKNYTRLYSKVQSYHDTTDKMEDKCDTNYLLIYQKCLELSSAKESFLPDMPSHDEVTMSFCPDTNIAVTLSIFPVLGKSEGQTQAIMPSREQKVGTSQAKLKGPSSQGSPPENETRSGNQSNTVLNPNQVLLVKKKASHRVKKNKDRFTCCISGICETASGQIVITDWKNKKVKVLDQTYHVVAHCDLSGEPWSTCHIRGNQVAVTVNGSSHQILFITIANGHLVKDLTITFQHSCRGIAHHGGKLYITSGTALYRYTVDGNLIHKMYEDMSDDKTVSACAVSPDGTKIYVANWDKNNLLTLSNDGRVLALMSLQGTDISDLHVTHLGQVLVCGCTSNTVFQVDSDLRQTLAKVVFGDYEMKRPKSIYYSERTSSLIAGMFRNDNILVFKA